MSASGQLSRQRSVTGSSLSARERMSAAQEHAMSSTTISAVVRHFDPCTATAGMFLYAQGSSIVCCHHDTLTIERRFSRHPDEVLLLAVDNVSERGAGRLVVSYDASQNAIVWDIMSGNEIARFASFSNLTAVAWMRNGAVAFGNDSGTIIIFEPETSEHLSFRTIDQIAVTALAPAADCRTFAIGYQNGSLLICTLQPRFTILHNLTTPRGPSPIVGVAWHASSARQRSDMLAVQRYDGDLRVWSVTKSHHNSDPAKIVRILKRTENYNPGPNWMNWSKNGRIIQFSEGETLSWDVRTKHVTYDSIPTLEHVRGLAVYGPGATLFTLGANNTVQQYDLNAPAVQVADVQHPANLLPPSPPVSVEEQEKAAAAAAAAAADTSASDVTAGSSAAETSESEISIHLDGGVSESDDDRMSPLARMVQAQAVDVSSDLERTTSPAPSSKSGLSSRTPGRYQQSIPSTSDISRGMTENTYISMGSSLKSSIAPHSQRRPQRQSMSTFSATTSSSFSATSNSLKPSTRQSHLRNEIPRSPDDAKVHDLFKFTRSRLSDIPYRMPQVPSNSSRLTNDDLRRQMLVTIFGWTQDIEDLVRDELSRHPAGSANRILLSKWLGDLDADIIQASSASMTSSDWMLLALSGIGGQASQHKLGRAYTQRLLESGDIHAAVTIVIGMGDHNDAIEIYVSHHKYMEALIVTCLFYPSVWERQSHLIKKWGEWAIKNGQRELAIRCFACTGKESTEPWTSPSAIQMSFPLIQSTLPEALSPPLSPPSVMQRGPQRSIAKTSTLRVITNFADGNVTRTKYFPDAERDGATPVAAGVTPIVDTAVSPGFGGNNDAATAFLRPSQNSTFNTPSSARPSGPGFGRQRLPSIGESTNDSKHPRNILKGATAALEPRAPRAEDTEPARASSRNAIPTTVNNTGPFDDNYMIGLSLQRASTSSPLYRRKEPPPPSPSPASLAMLMEGRTSRNGPRTRMPVGLDLDIAASQQHPGNVSTSPEHSGVSSNRYRWPTRRRGPASVSSSVTSSSSVAYGSRGNRFRTNETANVSKTLDEYINSLDAAKLRARPSSKERRQRSLSRHRRPSTSTNTSGAPTPTPTGHSRDPSSVEDRNWAPSRGYTSSKSGGKRSPSSPLPMSPEDLINLSTPKMFAKDDVAADGEAGSLTVKKTVATQQRSRPSSKSRPNSRTSSRGRGARNKSPDRRPPALEIDRGRNKSRGGSTIRSPSSPLPFSSNAAQYYASEDEDEDYKKAVDAQERFRNRDQAHTHRGRSSSRSRREEASKPDQARDRSQSRRRPSRTLDAAPGVATAAATAAAASSTRKDRGPAGPPPAPSAIAVASGVGVEKAPTPELQALGEEIDRRRTQSALSNRSNTGDLKQLTSNERAQRKAAAARELEERRRSLVRRPLAPPVVHPDKLRKPQTEVQHSSPPEMSESAYAERSAVPSDLSMRNQASEHGTTPKASKTRSMFATRGSSIGLPATPKAMRLVMEPGAGNSAPSIPPIPSSYVYQRQQPGSGKSSPQNRSPKMEEIPEAEKVHEFGSEAPTAPAPAAAPAAPPAAPAQEETLTLLPATVYQPPSSSRGAIPRSMSAPPEKMNFFRGNNSQDMLSPGKQGRGQRLVMPNSSHGDSFPMQMDMSIHTVMNSNVPSRNSRRPSVDNLVPPPPPPPPAPPMLKELAHLAMPPPPPPAPLSFGAAANSPQAGGYGGQGAGTIEVVMDDGQVQPILTMSPPPHSQSLSIPPPPPPPPPAPSANVDDSSQSRHGHNRGRSSTDYGIAGRLSRATERMRSASRSRNNTSAASRTKSPEAAFVPYESIPLPQAKSPEMVYAPYESVPAPLSFSSGASPPHQQQQQQQAPVLPINSSSSSSSSSKPRPRLRLKLSNSIKLSSELDFIEVR
ncbi:WD g-beta repeat protein [Niveomyces insectorum RCEF 264]|uniref:WD g-beta repeat protein n=1 Tax=Niveomyces insectorum RCEF 264 TaxID=1081102 RepID=A0A167Z8W3_9HYPO|nr:WD g-beta repeat protein [Niveomyces insectorum RCEF 264]